MVSFAYWDIEGGIETTEHKIPTQVGYSIAERNLDIYCPTHPPSITELQNVMSREALKMANPIWT